MTLFDNKRIIVADDDEQVRQVIVHQLRSLSSSLEVVEAKNGQELLSFVKAAKPDVIVLDLMMPIMDGYIALVELRSDEETSMIPVAVLTGYGDKHIEADLFRCGAEAYLTKPVSGLLLTATMHALMRIKSNYDRLRSMASKVDRSQEIARIRQTLKARLSKQVDEVFKELTLSTRGDAGQTIADSSV